MTMWRKSSYSTGDGGKCVELADLGDSIGLRDSKNPHQEPLRLSSKQLAGLLRAVKADELDSFA